MIQSPNDPEASRGNELNDLSANLNNSNNLQRQIVLFPNPASETIEIIGAGEIINTVVFDATGRKIQGLAVNNGTLYIRNLTAGTYFIEIYVESGVVFKRFVKQ